ncbi:MAG: hypothetical protein ACI83P_002556 [Janthinobacterium sp.]|jgi:hypothetical protein
MLVAPTEKISMDHLPPAVHERKTAAKILPLSAQRIERTEFADYFTIKTDEYLFKYTHLTLLPVFRSDRNQSVSHYSESMEDNPSLSIGRT